jgi:hypothetical protein
MVAAHLEPMDHDPFLAASPLGKNYDQYQSRGKHEAEHDPADDHAYNRLGHDTEATG